MQSKKTYVVLIVILFVFFIVMFSIFGIQSIFENKKELTLLVGNHAVWKYKDKKWNNIQELGQIEDLNWQEFQVYLNGENQGKYFLWYDDKWYAFDENKNSFSLDGSFMAYDVDHNLDVFYAPEEGVTDTMYIANVLKNHNISLSSKLTVSSKYSFDFDQDGEIEEFYTVGNAFALDFEPDVVFSFAFMVKGGTIYMIYDDVRNNDYFGGCKPYFTGFLDVDSDHQYEILFSCGRYSVEEEINTLYQFSNGTFEVLISN